MSGPRYIKLFLGAGQWRDAKRSRNREKKSLGLGEVELGCWEEGGGLSEGVRRGSVQEGKFDE